MTVEVDEYAEHVSTGSMKVAVIQKVRRPSFKRPTQYRWVLYAANGEKVSQSSETYNNRADALHGLVLTVGDLVLSTDMGNEWNARLLLAARAYTSVRGSKYRDLVGFVDRGDNTGKCIAVFDESK